MTHENLQPPATAIRRYRVCIDQLMSHDITIEAPDIDSAQRIALEKYEADHVLDYYILPKGWFVTYGIHEIAEVQEERDPQLQAPAAAPAEAAKVSVRDTFGLACPHCDRDDGIIVSTSECVRLLPDGTESVSDQEWALDSAVHCRHCGHAGIVAQFADDDGNEDATLAPKPPAQSLNVTSDICCELAHELTVRECAARDLTLDAEPSDDDVRYTEDAQDVFNAIYDIVTGVLQSSGKEVAR